MKYLRFKPSLCIRHNNILPHFYFIISLRKLQATAVGTRLLVTKAAKLPELLQAKVPVFGMQRQLMQPLLLATKHQLMRNQRVVIAGMKHRKQNVRRLVTTAAGQKPLKQIAPKVMELSNHRRPVPVNVVLVGTRHHRMQRHHR